MQRKLELNELHTVILLLDTRDVTGRFKGAALIFWTQYYSCWVHIIQQFEPISYTAWKKTEYSDLLLS